MKNYIDDNNIASICLPLRSRFNDGKVTVIKSKFKSDNLKSYGQDDSILSDVFLFSDGTTSP